jgi:ribosomal protein S20
VQEAEPSTEQEAAVVNGTRASEIHQESIKTTLKEIISEIEEAVVSEVISDGSAVRNKVRGEASHLLYC